ncbi:histone-like nucleoid-structuring protein Lsr2, partial [Rathayibacter tanaceti]
PPQVTIVGLGYVGLPTALAFFRAGWRVLGVDVSASRLDAIAAGHVDLFPEELEYLTPATASDRFVLHAEVGAVRGSEATIICVPTPVSQEQTPDLRPLSAACAAVVSSAVAGQCIILTSTTYVGCTELQLRREDVGEKLWAAVASAYEDDAHRSYTDEYCERQRADALESSQRGPVIPAARLPYRASALCWVTRPVHTGAVARKITLVDDLDGLLIPDGSTVQFSIDDSVYEIDLSPKNRQKLRDAFRPYIDASRRARYRTTDLPTVGPKK